MVRFAQGVVDSIFESQKSPLSARDARAVATGATRSGLRVEYQAMKKAESHSQVLELAGLKAADASMEHDGIISPRMHLSEV